MVFMLRPSDESGDAADTGSATHVAIQAWHNTGDAAAAIDALRNGLQHYPKANVNEAVAMFFHYTKDPQNTQAKVIATEQQITFTVDPIPEDPTGEKIVIVGTLDQLREIDGVLKIYDVKTSKKEPMKLMQQHMMQVAAYCIGASIKHGRPVEPGALILPRRYPDKNAFFNYVFSISQIAPMFDGLRRAVAAIRAGKPSLMPDEYCQWCPMKSVDNCLPKLTELSVNRTVTGS